MANFVNLHSAWHTGKELAQTAEIIRGAGRRAYTPTLAGNRPGDSKRTGLGEIGFRQLDAPPATTLVSRNDASNKRLTDPVIELEAAHVELKTRAVTRLTYSNTRQWPERDGG
jgi:hypothetical protein